MSDHHARFARDDVYDHEHDEPRSARRRRPVADWGVGDDVFDHMPRNRFSRAAEGPSRERRFSREGPDRRAADDAHHDEAPGAGDAADTDVLPRTDAPDDTGPRDRRTDTPDPPRGGAADGRRTIVIGRPEDMPSEIEAVTADRDLGDEEPAAALTQPAPAERRTVRIAGRPEGSLEAARYHREHGGRHRPPRTAHERIGARPDRIAMWAFALGMLLILIAVLTAG